MLKAIVFDFDGVIVDTEPLHFRAFQHIAASLRLSIDYRYYLDRLIGFDDRDVCRLLLARAQGAAEDAGPADYRGDPAPVTALCAAKARAFADAARDGAAAIDGVLGLVDAASRRMPLAISSGAIRADIEPILTALGLTGRFDPVVTADDVLRSKPDPEVYARAVAGLAARHCQLAIRPADCLAIEDTPAGVASARTAGLRVLGVTTSMPADLLADADRVVAGFAGLTVEQLGRWFA